MGWLDNIQYSADTAADVVFRHQEEDRKKIAEKLSKEKTERFHTVLKKVALNGDGSLKCPYVIDISGEEKLASLDREVFDLFEKITRLKFNPSSVSITYDLSETINIITKEEQVREEYYSGKTDNEYKQEVEARIKSVEIQAANHGELKAKARNAFRQQYKKYNGPKRRSGRLYEYMASLVNQVTTLTKQVSDLTQEVKALKEGGEK